MEKNRQKQYRFELQNRLSNCTTVVNDIASSEAWKILIEDMQKQKEQIDNNWQDVFDSDKLNALRVLKNAVQHILLVPKKYLEEKEQLEEQLERMDNPKDYIEKDYDAE